MTTGRINQISIDLVLFVFCFDDDNECELFFLSVKSKKERRIGFVKARTNQQGIASMPVLLLGLCFDDLISVF